MMRLLSLLLAIGTMTVLYSCSSSRKARTKPPVVIIDTTIRETTVKPVTEDTEAIAQELYNGIISNRIDFESFSAKIDVDFVDGKGSKMNVNAHVRMQKDSVIWLSLTGPLGIEGMRVLITTDSVRIIDKQNKIYRTRDLGVLEDITGLPLDIHTLQDLLIGNPVYFTSMIEYYVRNGNTVTLISKGDVFNHQLTADVSKKQLQASLLTNPLPDNKRSCSIGYSDYETKKNIQFAEKRSLVIKDTVTLSLDLNYKQYDFNEKLSFPFNVPKNYDSN